MELKDKLYWSFLGLVLTDHCTTIKLINKYGLEGEISPIISNLFPIISYYIFPLIFLFNACSFFYLKENSPSRWTEISLSFLITMFIILIINNLLILF